MYFQFPTGITKIETDKNYVATHGYATMLDECVVYAVSLQGEFSNKNGSAFLDNLVNLLVGSYHNPRRPAQNSHTLLYKVEKSRRGREIHRGGVPCNR